MGKEAGAASAKTFLGKAPPFLSLLSSDDESSLLPLCTSKQGGGGGGKGCPGRAPPPKPKREEEATPKDGKGSIDVMYEQRLEQTYYKIKCQIIYRSVT